MFDIGAGIPYDIYHPIYKPPRLHPYGVEGEGESMDEEVAIELYTILFIIFRVNNIDPPAELDAMAQGIMMGNKHMVMRNLYTLLKIITELVEKLAMS
jgi:hypothetical protein